MLEGGGEKKEERGGKRRGERERERGGGGGGEKRKSGPVEMGYKVHVQCTVYTYTNGRIEKRRQLEIDRKRIKSGLIGVKLKG